MDDLRVEDLKQTQCFNKLQIKEINMKPSVTRPVDKGHAASCETCLSALSDEAQKEIADWLDEKVAKKKRLYSMINDLMKTTQNQTPT